jgi:hypothetical protein
MGESARIEHVVGADPLTALDATLGVTITAVGAVSGLGRRFAAVTGPLARPVVGLVLRPPVVAERYRPGTWLVVAARRGADRRDLVAQQLTALLDVLVPAVAHALLRRMDLTEVVRRYVDLDGLVASVDLDVAVSRVDLDAVVGRLDLDRIVRERVDLDRIVSTVDIDAIAARIDIDAIAARIDIDAVLNRIDLVGLAEDVIAEVDLPEIIRESTGTMASDTVRGVRMQGITADEAIGRAVNRLRRGRRGPAPPGPDGPDGPMLTPTVQP